MAGPESMGKKKKRHEEFNQVKMPHHSFTAPLEYVTLLDEWVLSGASLFEREHLLIHPELADMAGFAWNRLAVLTNDFEVTFHFKIAGSKDITQTLSDSGLAFWYVKENISDVFNQTKIVIAESKDWKKGMQQQGFTYYGSKAKFNGFGVVISNRDSGHNSRPMVSYVSNDGKQDEPKLGPTKSVDFRNTLNSAQLRIRVKPFEVTGELKQSPSLSWNECFKVDRSKDPIEAGGFIGITAWSGSKSGGTADKITMTEVNVTNHDDTQIGEDIFDLNDEIANAYKNMLTDERRHFTDQASQTSHMRLLQDMIDQHFGSSKMEEELIYQDIKGLEQRLTRLERDCSSLTMSARVLMKAKGGRYEGSRAHGVAAMKNQIIGLRRMLQKEGAIQQEKLSAVQKDITEIKTKNTILSSGPGEALTKIWKQSAQLEETVVSRGWQMTWMMLCLMGAVVAIGTLMWNRMNYYEKKHFL